MTQKVIKIGTSVGVTIPKQALVDLHLRAGGHVDASWDTEKGVIIFRKARRSAVSKKLPPWMERFLKEYGPALQTLSRVDSKENYRVTQQVKKFIRQYCRDLENLARK